MSSDSAFSNFTGSQPTGPKLLVSVRSAQEALDAIAGPVDIIDIKEPSNGPLGMSSLIDMYQIAATVRASAPIPLSAALGELKDWNLQPLPALPPHLTFAKLGLAGMKQEPHWKAIWKQVRTEFDVLRGMPLEWVAVAYADAHKASAPTVSDVMQAALETECRVLLIDTFEKGPQRLLDLLSLDELRNLIQQAHFHQIQIALAGQLHLDDLPQLLPLGADILAIRGAVCEAGQREAGISPAAIQQFLQSIQTAFVARETITNIPKTKTTESSTRKLTLDQFMKLQGWVGTGGQAKYVIQQGLVRVNGEVDTRRRRQLSVGDRVEFENQTAQVESID